MSRSIVNDPSNIYFVYADNEYESRYNFQTFRAILNFYALFYDKVVVPDSFFINNRHLIELFESSGKNNYVHHGIIVPCARNGVKKLSQVHEQFKEKGIIKPALENRLTSDYLNSIDLRKAATWEHSTSAAAFSESVFQIIDTNAADLGMTRDEKRHFLEGIEDSVQAGCLNRSEIRRMLTETAFVEAGTSKNLMDVTDMIYNFNLPTTLGITAAYPEVLEEAYRRFRSPRSTVFRDQTPSTIASSIKDESETLLFDYGLLSSLDVEQVAAIRSSVEFKKFTNVLKKTDGSDESLLESFRVYNHAVTTKILPEVILKEQYEKTKKRKRSMNVRQNVYDVGKEVVSFSLGLTVPATTAALLPVLFKGMDFLFKKTQTSLSNEWDTSQMAYEGSMKIKEIKNGKHILNKMISLNTTSPNE